MMSFLPELLQHQRRAPALEPTPAKLAIVYPLFRHLEAEAVNVIANGLFDVRHSEKRHCLLDVRFGFHFRFDCLIPGRIYFEKQIVALKSYIAPNQYRER